jgi:hypothetical protein
VQHFDFLLAANIALGDIAQGHECSHGASSLSAG